MIDDKKIEEAARQHLAAFRDANTDGYSSSISDMENDCFNNFKAGAKWAINEFLKDLWHPVSEEPDLRHKEIVCIYTDGDIKWDDNLCGYVLDGDKLGNYPFDWECYVNNKIEYWCYKDDLFPKK